VTNTSQSDLVIRLPILLFIIDFGRALPNHSGGTAPDLRSYLGHEAPQFGVRLGPPPASVLFRHSLQDPESVAVGPAEARENNRAIFDA
jgi:hypothetical protein